MATLFPTIHGYRVNINGLDLSQGWSDAKLRDVMYQLTASPTDEALILESCSGLEADRIMNPGTMILEALTSQFEKLDRTISKVGGLINSALSGKMKDKIDNQNGLTIDNENIFLGPIRKNNLFAYRTATFNVSDGQTVSILFHSPDSDPMVMEAGETLIAYRWMLNKTDITPAVAPEGGKDITAFQMATRLAKLIIANSPKFTANANNRAENAAQLQEAENKRAELRDRANLTTADIQQLEENLVSISNRISKIDESLATARAKNERLKAAKAQPAPPPAPTPAPIDVSVTYTSGNDTITSRASQANKWESNDGKSKRTYYNIETKKGVKPSVKGIAKLYEINEGGTKDNTVTVAGKTYGYTTDAGVDSNTKRKAVEEAVIELVGLIQKATAEAPLPAEPMPVADLTGTRFELVQLPARGSKETDIKNIEFDFTKIAKMIKQDCQTMLGSAAYGSVISVTQQKPYISIKVTALPDGVTAQSKDASAMLAALQAIGEAYMVEKDGAQNIRAINVALDSRLTTSAPTPAQKLYRYAMVNRPVSIGTTPKDGLVGTEPRPNAGDAHYATARNGIAVFNRKLTDAETKQFEMSPMVGGEDMREYANMVAKKMGEYASAYLDMEEEDHKSFLNTVDSFIKNNDAGYYPSLENKSEFVDMVKGMLIDIASAPETYPAPTPEPEPEPEPAAGGDVKQALIEEAQALINSKISDPKELELALTAFENKVEGQGLLDDLIPWLDQIANNVTKLAREKATKNGA